MDEKTEKKLKKWTRMAAGGALILKNSGRRKAALKLGELQVKEAVGAPGYNIIG